MKLNKALCCMLFSFFGLNGAQNTIVFYSVLSEELTSRNVLVA